MDESKSDPWNKLDENDEFWIKFERDLKAAENSSTSEEDRKLYASAITSCREMRSGFSKIFGKEIVKFCDSADDYGWKARETIFKLATGTLALSIAFKGAFATPFTVGNWMLIATWILFLISCVSYVIAFLAASFEKQLLASLVRKMSSAMKIDPSDCWSFQGENPLMQRLIEQPRAMRLMLRNFKFLAAFQFPAFLAALIFLVIFASRNVG